MGPDVAVGLHNRRATSGDSAGVLLRVLVDKALQKVGECKVREWVALVLDQFGLEQRLCKLAHRGVVVARELGLQTKTKNKKQKKQKKFS